MVLALLLLTLTGCVRYSNGEPVESKDKDTAKTEEKTSTNEENKENDTKQKEDKVDYKAEAEKNAEENPATSGTMLYDKTETKFKGMNYYFTGEVVKIQKVEGLLGKMEDAMLVKNENGYVLPIFPPFQMDIKVGDTIKAWGPLSGDGYAAGDFEVDNVVGMTGAMNATEIQVN